MITSNKRRSARYLSAGLALALGGISAALAQDAPSAPPPTAVTTPASPSSVSPGAGPISILPTPDPDAPAEPATPTIAVGELAAPGIDRLGLVGAAKGGFGSDLWAGTDPAFLKQILDLLPAHIRSVAERRIAENLLLSSGPPPTLPDAAVADASAAPGQAAADGAAPVQVSDAAPAAATRTFGALDPAALLQARVRALAALGDWADAVALIELVPADQMNDGLRRIAADGALATNHLNAACNAADAALKSSADVYWQKLQVFCGLNAGEASAAGLGLDVLREQHLDDPAFFWAVDLLQGTRKPAPASVTTLTPLTLAMVRKAGGPVPDAVAKSSDPTVMGIVAAIPSPDEGAITDKISDAAKHDRQQRAIEARILLAERAMAGGALDVEVLRNLYKAVDFKQDPALPQPTKIAPDDVRGRAFLYQSALVQTVPTARAEVITRAVELARLDGGEKGPDITVVGRVYSGLLGQTEVSGELVWFSATAARALLAAGEPEHAKAWLDLVHDMARNSLEATTIADSLWPLERLLSPAKGPMPPGALRAWSTTVPEVMLAAERATLLNLFIAVGESVNPGQLSQEMSETADASPAVRPLVWNGLTLAARGKRVGETAALSLVALGEDGPAHVAPATLQKITESLIAVDRERDARALAVETALIRGL